MWQYRVYMQWGRHGAIRWLKVADKKQADQYATWFGHTYRRVWVRRVWVPVRARKGR